VVGSEAPREELASAEARAAFLRPSGGTRLVVRDAVLKSWEATRLELSRDPPAVEVKLDVEAVRYVVRDSGSAVAGNHTDVRPMAVTWVLELTNSARAPWRLATSSNPAKAIPGWP
jgi:predicted lipid-binding transport protein (Tim44 family)